MIKENLKWKALTQAFHPGLKETLFQHYYGAQFIAMAGRHLIKQRDDDSNTSMVFDPERQSLIGEILPNNTQLQLDLSNLTLSLFRKDSLPAPGVQMIGLTSEAVFSKFSHMLKYEGINIDNLKNNLHYDLPDHDLLHDSVFKDDDPALIRENIAYRHNAEFVLNHIISGYKHADQVRIWPHHFDTGTFIPLNWDSSGKTSRSVGLGWAIPDGMVEEPYYYLSIWAEDPLELSANMPALEAGQWMMPGWNGAVLKLSEILSVPSSQKQFERVLSFFNSGLRIIQGQ